MKKIGILASGAGSNARKIMEHFAEGHTARVTVVITNNDRAGVITVAKEFAVPVELISNADIEQGEELMGALRLWQVDFIVLAGFLRLLPAGVVEQYKGRIVNIHPALLPMHGGKGMFGTNVHRAVLQSGATESGITIHFVDDKYDSGDIIFQARVTIEPGETPESLAEKIHILEHKYYPQVIEELLSK